jgi:hypothetical protein
VFSVIDLTSMGTMNWLWRAFPKMKLFWAARNATKNGPVLGRPGIRFAAPKIITKEAKFCGHLAEI